jgi:hypothetical protein
MSLEKLTEYSKKVSLLLLINAISSYTAGTVGAKLYDYLSFRKPILAIGPKPSILDTVLSETASGKVLEDNDVVGIKSYIESVFKVWEKKGTTLLNFSESLKPYSGEYNVAKLVQIFEKIK